MKLRKKKLDQENCYLSNNCLKEWLPAIEANKKVYEFKKGEPLFKEGDLVEGIYFIYAGKVKVHKKWGDKELILRVASGGSIIGHRGLTKSSKTYSISATALENGVLASTSFDFFDSTLKVNPDFTYSLLIFFADELRESERKMRNIAHMCVKGRIAAAILEFKVQFGTDEQKALKIELSKQDFAAYIGATYETLFRMLNELITDKIIKVDKRKITILDEARLIELSEKEE
nr:Crp/Fnr family transcriptional regulator [uncultured Pedobacter sp.]